MTETAVITKPSASRLINSSRRLKLLTGGLGVVFRETFLVGRGCGLGRASGLTLSRLLALAGLFMSKTIQTDNPDKAGL
jgi:hypothetical protein